MFAETLSRLAMRVATPEYDPRHAILDVAPELLGLDASTPGLPEHLATELRELIAEVRVIQPAYPSRRNTSVLFDRGGLGRLGVDRAERLARRLASLAKSVARVEDRR